MKRGLFVAFCILALSSLSLLISAAPGNAAYSGYSHMVYPIQNTVTFDGKWTSDAEWTDGTSTSFGTNSVFVSKWGPYGSETSVPQYFLIEILNDATNDENDYWQICFDGDMSGGTAPGANDLLINIGGHGTNVTFYQGTGTGWASMATPSAANFQWKDSISSSPKSSTPHWICEIMINKPVLNVGAQYWARVAVNDAGGAGVQAWPPTSRDVPSDWGDFPYSGDAIPESLTFGIVALLSSVAVVASFYLLRKRPETQGSSAKLSAY